MKAWLRISFVVNGLLAGLAVWLVCHPNGNPTPPPAVVASQLVAPPEASSQAFVSKTPPPSAAIAPPPPFRWSQLDALDYHTYVKNLRDIGCPEPTLLAIVTSDVHAVFKIRANKLKRKLAELSSAPWSTRLTAAADEQALKSQLEQLAVEETAKVNDLLGLKPAPVETFAPVASPGALSGEHPSTGDNAAATNFFSSLDPAPVAAFAQLPLPIQASGDKNLPVGQGRISVPLVFQPADPEAMNLNESQAQVVNQVRQSFLDAVSNTSRRPEDPAYLNQWQAAQDAADRMLLGQLGEQGYFNYEMALHPFQQ